MVEVAKAEGLKKKTKKQNGKTKNKVRQVKMRKINAGSKKEPLFETKIKD